MHGENDRVTDLERLEAGFQDADEVLLRPSAAAMWAMTAWRCAVR